MLSCSRLLCALTSANGSATVILLYLLDQDAAEAMANEYESSHRILE
jgi:hypothetical protein